MKNKIILLLTISCLFVSGADAQSTANTSYGAGAGTGGSATNGNAFFGGSAGRVTTGASNAFLGTNAGYFNTTGNGNVFSGSASGWFNSTGSNNVNIGNGAAYFNSTGSNNTAIGTSALWSNTSSSNNTAIGNGAGYSALGSGNLFLGYNAGSAETGSNKLYIANSGTTSPLIFGDFAAGNVAIGKNSAAYKLDVNGTVNATSFLVSGSVGIGTTTPGSFKLAVEGKIWAKEVQVALTNPGPDYVFEPTYDLKPLAEIETYIKENKHLPEVPSAKEMEKNGVQLGEMNMLLLKKVEELTLHLIEQNRKLDEMKKENEAQNEVIKSLIDKQKK